MQSLKHSLPAFLKHGDLLRRQDVTGEDSYLRSKSLTEALALSQSRNLFDKLRPLRT
jgi:hypothetical protein